MARRAASADDVFVNCPFDADYRPLFHALIFTIYACGFRARSAFEIDDAGEARIEKLVGLIRESRYGIHDLSRTELDATHGLPRFNMPLELGLFLGAKRFGTGVQKEKRLLVLDIERFRFQKFISDLAGMDIHEHGGNPLRAVIETRDWLANVSRRRLPSGDLLAARYEAFVGQFPGLAADLGFTTPDLPYVDFERIVAEWLLGFSPPI